MGTVDEAAAWFKQADSDVRTAEALFSRPAPMLSVDVGCHVAAMCAQAVEKSIKGYVILNGATPSMDHRPDKYLSPLLGRRPLLRYPNHHQEISKLFDAGTKGTIRTLLDLTPGGLGNRPDVQNTEYPWTDSAGRHQAAVEAQCFGDRETLQDWLNTAKRVCSTLHKLGIAAGMAPGRRHR